MSLSNDLAAAIFAARANPANASFFANTPSNYLQGEVNKRNITVPDLKTIAGTGTFNIVTPQGYFNVNSNLQASLISTRSNSVNPPAYNPDVPSTQQQYQPVNTTQNSTTDSFNTAIHNITNTLTSHPGIIIGIGALVAFLVLRK